MKFQVFGKGEGKTHPFIPSVITFEPQEDVAKLLEKEIPKIAKQMEKHGVKPKTIELKIQITNWSEE